MLSVYSPPKVQPSTNAPLVAAIKDVKVASLMAAEALKQSVATRAERNHKFHDCEAVRHANRPDIDFSNLRISRLQRKLTRLRSERVADLSERSRPLIDEMNEHLRKCGELIREVKSAEYAYRCAERAYKRAEEECDLAMQLMWEAFDSYDALRSV